MEHGRERTTQANGEAVTAAFVRLSDRLVGTAWGVLGHREDAREAVQDAFVKCWRRRHELTTLATLDAFVFTVTLNAAKDLRRRRAVRRSDALPAEDTMPADERHESPPAVAERSELVARVRAALPGLPDAEREVFLLRQNGDLTYTAIAGVLGAPVGTVKTRMRAALRRLREALAEPAREGTPRLEPGR